MRRRSWLKLGIGSATLLVLGGGAVALVEPGLRAGHLTAVGRQVFSQVAAAILEGTLPRDAALHATSVEALLVRVDTLLVALPLHAQSELSQLLALLGTAPGRRALAGIDVRWPDATNAQVQAGLQSMRTSSLALRQQAYHALHDISLAAYFSDPSTWAVLGYPGPVAV